MTKAKYSLSRMPQNGFEVGPFGYFLAVLQFLGFIFGGVCVYFHLASIQMCQKCKKYFRKLASREMDFAQYDLFKPFATKMYQVGPFSPEYIELFSQPTFVLKPESGAVKMIFTLHGCPGCKQQYVAEDVKILNGKNWKSVSDLCRKNLMPENSNLLSEFKKKGA